MEKPKTQKDTLDAVYYGLYGTPGAPGMIERFENHLDGNGTKKNGKKPRRVEILFGFMGALMAAQSLGVTEGIRVAVVRWLSGGVG